MGRVAAWLRRRAAETWTPPFPQPLPSNAARYAAAAPLRRILWRRFRRALWLRATGQRRLERSRIGEGDRRILWIHAGMPQVGDSLMDLACRGLLRGRAVDLLIDPHLVPLYAHDDVFAHAWGDPAEAAKNAYDLVIVLGASSHNLGAKLRHFRDCPWVSLHGFYTGPEFHRTLFAWYRLDQLLGGSASESEVLPVACPHLVVAAEAVRAVDALALPARFVAVAVGGVRDWRSYAHWAEVVTALRAAGVDEPVILLGAANGRAERDRILATAAAGVIDRVERHALPEVYEILRRATLAVCADGGLLHVANAARTPTVSLFAERIDPAYRLTPANRSIAFYDAIEVSRIAPQAIAAAVAGALREPIDGVTVIGG
jgi:heptosyltransferase-2